VVGCENHAHGAQYQIEVGIGARQVLGVALEERHRKMLGGGLFPALFEQLRGIVDTGRLREPPRGRDRRVALPARDVKNPKPRTDVGGLDQQLGDDLQVIADAGVVAGLPAGALVVGDCREIATVVVITFSFRRRRRHTSEGNTGSV
jgi:hypothetical protein